MVDSVGLSRLRGKDAGCVNGRVEMSQVRILSFLVIIISRKFSKSFCHKNRKLNLDYGPVKIATVYFVCMYVYGGAHLHPVVDKIDNNYIIIYKEK